MGYVRKKTIITMKWPADHEWHELEVRVLQIDIEQMMRLGAMATAAGEALSNLGEDPTSEGLAQATLASVAMYAEFARVLRGWNLQEEQEDGKVVDVPATAEGLESQGLDFALPLISAYMDTVRGVPAPLGSGSSGGGSSPALSTLPVELLSPSPAS